ncbi:MAG: TonB-dependent receptor, partial [Candidatus Aminicenantes bacterium]|nr:TonB-dependent receptor [Candidatus Aminicenantes bacterium]
LDNTLDISPVNSLEFGFQWTKNDITYGYDQETDEEESDDDNDENTRNLFNILNQDQSGSYSSGYIQDRWTLFNKLTLTPGLRYTHFDVTGENFLEPRLSARLNLSERFSIKGAWGHYHQFVNRVTREDLMQGNREFWSLANGEEVPIGQAVHYIGGVSYETPTWLVDVEAYHKDLEGLTEFALRNTPFQPPQEGNFNNFFEQGTGIAEGVEFLLQKKAGNPYGWICYTLSRVEYDFPELSDEPYPALHDQTHEFKFVGILELGKWSVSSTWIYATGKPYTEPGGTESIELFNGRSISRVTYGEKNAARLPDYHRMDVAVNRRFKLGTADCLLGASIFNLYARKNVWYKEYDVIEGEIIDTNVLFMGWTANLSFSIKF